MIRFAPAKCKFCGCQVAAKWEDGDPEQAVDKFLPMLACNPCADAHRARNDSAAAIMTRCFEMARLPETGRGKIIAETRAQLEVLTKKYAAAISYILNARNFWRPEMVQVLLDKPGDAEEILRLYRQQARQDARERNEVMV